MTDGNKPSLENVAARLKAARDAAAGKRETEQRKRERSRGLGLGMRIGIELVVAVLVGGGIGLFIDDRLNTTPIFLLAFLALGFTAGVLNVVRISRGLDEAVGVGRAVREKEEREDASGEAGENESKEAPEQNRRPD